MNHGADFAGVRWKSDRYFERDGRNIGTAGWFTVASNLCIDLWHPIDDLNLEQVYARIFPIQVELNSGLMDHGHFVDDYVLSRNVAKYGLKYTTFKEVMDRLRRPYQIWHAFNIPEGQKIEEMQTVICNWGVFDLQAYNPAANLIPGWMTRSELYWLYLNARSRRTIVEIGTWKGRSTHALCSGAMRSGGQVYAVDTFKGSPSELSDRHSEALTIDMEAQCRRNLAAFKNVSVLAMDSTEAAAHFADAGIDMIFVDGEHTREAFTRDLAAWRPKLAPGGLLCGHDRDRPGVSETLKESVPGFQMGPGSIWFVQLNKFYSCGY